MYAVVPEFWHAFTALERRIEVSLIAVCRAVDIFWLYFNCYNGASVDVVCFVYRAFLYRSKIFFTGVEDIATVGMMAHLKRQHRGSDLTTSCQSIEEAESAQNQFGRQV